MRALAIVALLLAHSITQEQEPPPVHGDPSSYPRCAAIEHDHGELKACKCAAASGSPQFCDKDGNRTTHSMNGCVNGANCKAHCCKCCPRD